MKKRLLIILLFVCLFLTGCGQLFSDPFTVFGVPLFSHTDPTPSDDTITQLPPAIPVREFGESVAYIQLNNELMVHILYPESEISSLNQEISHWITQTVALYQEEAAGSSQYHDTAELTAEYSSYLFCDHLVSVKISGLFDRPYLAHPVDIIATFHADITSGTMLELDDLLLENGRTQLEKMVIEDAALKPEDTDDALLNLWTLTPDGLEIILERGTYLPMSAGTVTLCYSYEELKDILSLADALANDTPPNQPIAEPQPLPPSDMPPEETSPEEPAETPSQIPEQSAERVIDPNLPMVALTFDDGPSKHTDRLLDIFAQYGGKGTFFLIGNIIDNRPDTARRITQEGHEIAGHSWDHRQMTKLTQDVITDQITHTRAKILEVTGVDTTLLRPPYGSYNETVQKVCTELGIVMVNWCVDTLDWDHKDPDKIYDAIFDTIKDGNIILCHDLYGTTVDAMERVIPALVEKGYQLVTVSELLYYSGQEMVAGNVYKNGF